MMYDSKEQAQLECDLLNRKPEQMKVFVPAQKLHVGWRERTARLFWTPSVDWDATRSRTRRLINMSPS